MLRTQPRSGRILSVFALAWRAGSGKIRSRPGRWQTRCANLHQNFSATSVTDCLLSEIANIGSAKYNVRPTSARAMTMPRFSEWFAFGALTCWMGLGLMRALMLRARGVSVFVADRQRTGGQMLADTVMLACLLAFAYEIIAYAWQLRFHIGASVLDRSVVDGLASQALGALIVTGAVILYVIALRDLGASWRLGLDRSAPGPLVTGGVYRWTRHPIYVAFDLWFMGTFLLIGRLSFLVLALVWVPLLHAIMDREDRFLTGLYGDAYRDYSRRVGRYFLRQRHE